MNSQPKTGDRNNLEDSEEEILVPDGSNQDGRRNSKRPNFQPSSMRKSQTMGNGFYQGTNQNPDLNNNSYNRSLPKSNSGNGFDAQYQPNQMQNQFMPNMQSQFYQQNRYNQYGSNIGMLPEHQIYQMPPMIQNFGPNWNSMPYQHHNNFSHSNNQFFPRNHDGNLHPRQNFFTNNMNQMQGVNQNQPDARFNQYQRPPQNYQYNEPNQFQQNNSQQNFQHNATSNIVDRRFIQDTKIHQNNFIKKSF